MAGETGLSKAQEARDLGANPEALRPWVKRAEIDAGRRDGLTDEKGASANHDIRGGVGNEMATESSPTLRRMLMT